MKAFVKRASASDGIEFRDIPSPENGDSELLVRVRAIGVGIHDGYFLPTGVPYPYVVGIEAAGIVERVGADVEAFQSGERIAFVSAMQQKGGTWAEYAVVDSRSLILRLPDAVIFEEAAALPVAGNTALRALFCLDLLPGDVLFIAGASGAIGTLAIQFAVARGFRVVASASFRNHDYLRALGVEHVVDYHDPNWQKQIRSWFPGGVAAAIGIQPDTARQSESVVRDGGTIVAISGDQFAPERGIVLKQVPPDLDVKNDLQDVIEQVGAGTIRVEIARVYPFAEGLDALTEAATRHTRGKIVLTLA